MFPTANVTASAALKNMLQVHHGRTAPHRSQTESADEFDDDANAKTASPEEKDTATLPAGLLTPAPTENPVPRLTTLRNHSGSYGSYGNFGPPGAPMHGNTSALKTTAAPLNGSIDDMMALVNHSGVEVPRWLKVAYARHHPPTPLPTDPPPTAAPTPITAAPTESPTLPPTTAAPTPLAHRQHWSRYDAIVAEDPTAGADAFVEGRRSKLQLPKQWTVKDATARRNETNGNGEVEDVWHFSTSQTNVQLSPFDKDTLATFCEPAGAEWSTQTGMTEHERVSKTNSDCKSFLVNEIFDVSQLFDGDTAMITGFKPIVTRQANLGTPDNAIIHHMDLFLCTSAIAERFPPVTRFMPDLWGKAKTGHSCDQILFAYDRDAVDGFQLPAEAGFRVGIGTPYTHLLMNWHYVLGYEGLGTLRNAGVMNFQDNSGFDISVIRGPNLREHAAATFTLIDAHAKFPTVSASSKYSFSVTDDGMRKVLRNDWKWARSRTGAAALHPFAVHLHMHDHGLASWMDHVRPMSSPIRKVAGVHANTTAVLAKHTSVHSNMTTLLAKHANMTSLLAKLTEMQNSVLRCKYPSPSCDWCNADRETCGCEEAQRSPTPTCEGATVKCHCLPPVPNATTAEPDPTAPPNRRLRAGTRGTPGGAAGGVTPPSVPLTTPAAKAREVIGQYGYLSKYAGPNVAWQAIGRAEMFNPLDAASRRANPSRNPNFHTGTPFTSTLADDITGAQPAAPPPLRNKTGSVKALRPGDTLRLNCVMNARDKTAFSRAAGPKEQWVHSTMEQVRALGCVRRIANMRAPH
jgi:hypothetical protein